MDSIGRASRRVMSDIRAMTRDATLKKSGIFFQVNESDIFDIKALIIGPEDTPYEGGFFCFQINIDKVQYPMVPPKVKFITTDGRIRFNPNLYEDGKVCLSLLGTWSGPGWVPCNTITTVLIAIQGMVLNDWPL